MRSRPRDSSSRPALSIIIPVFNEAAYIGDTVVTTLDAVDASGWDAEIVIVDDGSTDATPSVLENIASRNERVRVVRTSNRGRFLARKTGVLEARSAHTLLLDARVRVGAQSLTFLRRQLQTHPDRVLWNADVSVISHRNPFADFWEVLVRLGFFRYYLNREHSSFGLDDFELFPKGTGCFAAPTEWLLEAVASYSPEVGDIRLSSDDTRLLRYLAGRSEIHLSPEFSCRYIPRDSFGAFIRHSYFRGTTFVDGYLRSSGHVGKVFRPLLAISPAAAAALGLALLRWPRRTLGAFAGAAGAVSAMSLRLGNSPTQVVAFLGLLPAFSGAFGAGIIRGLLLARTRSPMRGTGSGEDD